MCRTLQTERGRATGTQAGSSATCPIGMSQRERAVWPHQAGRICLSRLRTSLDLRGGA